MGAMIVTAAAAAALPRPAAAAFGPMVVVGVMRVQMVRRPVGMVVGVAMVVVMGVIVPVAVVVVMPMIVVMRVVVVMPVVMPVVMIVPVALVVRMPMGVAMGMAMGAAVAIGAAFGREGLDHLAHGRADPAQHVQKHVIALDQKPRLFDLAGRVTVADMPGEPGQIGARDLQQGFGRGLHDNAAPVFQHDQIALGQRGRMGQIQQEGEPAIADQPLAAQEPRIIVKRHAVRTRACAGPDLKRHRKPAHAAASGAQSPS